MFKPFLSALLALGLLSAPLRAVAAEDVPFITTPDNVTLAMLQLAGVQRSDHVIDLGSGDGRIVITAARRFGASGLGVEIVPELVERSRDAAQKAGVQQRVEFREQDLFKTDLAPATVITMYLLPEVNLQLRPLLLNLAPGTRIVSHDWDLGDWLPDATVTVAAPNKTIGREKLSRLHRWVVPARAQGLWCGPGGVQLRLTQQYQAVRALWQQGAFEAALFGALDGPRLRLVGGAPAGAALAPPAGRQPGLSRELPAQQAQGLQGRVDGQRLWVDRAPRPARAVVPGRPLVVPLLLQKTEAAACAA